MPQTARREQGPARHQTEPTPAALADEDGLVFQRCLWCGSPAYHRSFCRTCGSEKLSSRRSTGAGAVVRRYPPVVRNTFVIAMDEGFTVVCRFSDWPDGTVPPGARVRLVHPVDPVRQDLPVVELVEPAPAPGPRP